jgi:hypothetical protein
MLGHTYVYSKKGFSTDRRARVELVAKNWSGGTSLSPAAFCELLLATQAFTAFCNSRGTGAAWLLGLQLVDSFEYSLAQVVLGRSHWHPWGGFDSLKITNSEFQADNFSCFLEC